MTKSAEAMKKRLKKFKTTVNSCSLSTIRVGQQAIGLLSTLPRSRKDAFETVSFRSFAMGKLTPEVIADPEAVILYLHGGGFVAGGLAYARGFATVLADELSLPAFCPAYRLAPEHRFPAALKDALTAYCYLTGPLKRPADKVILVGESAGGGLLYSLCLMLKRMRKPMPAGLVAISPWTDLTLSGLSYEANREADPSLTVERLRYFASCYTDTPADPYASPLFADLTGLPPSLILSGGAEIMLSDASLLHEKLTACGCRSEHRIAPDLWHAYLLYRIEERKAEFDRIRDFVKEMIAP